MPKKKDEAQTDIVDAVNADTVVEKNVDLLWDAIQEGITHDKLRTILRGVIAEITTPIEAEPSTPE